MTQNRARNRAIRERMKRTGESFTQATRRMVNDHEGKQRKAHADERSSGTAPSGSTALKFSDADPEAEA